MNNNKTIIAAIIVVIGMMIGAFMISIAGSGGDNSSGAKANNVYIVDGKQIIEIDVKGGYRPGRSVAKAGIPAVIRFRTNGTFDCSSSIRIPSLNISQILPQTGVTDIDIGIQNAGTLAGTCGMGMYRFEVDFN